MVTGLHVDLFELAGVLNGAVLEQESAGSAVIRC